LFFSKGAREEPAVRPPSHFQLTVDESAARPQLRLVGEFDRAAVGRVERALEHVFQAPPTKQVVIDLRLLTFLDTAGLLALLRAHDRARACAFELVLVRPRGTANRVFTLTRAGEALSMVDEPVPGESGSGPGVDPRASVLHSCP
jgi:anti-sigma B factor antagonist